MLDAKRQQMLEVNKKQKFFYELWDRPPGGRGNILTRLWRKARRRQLTLRDKIGVDQRVNALHRTWLGDLSEKRVLDLGCHAGNPLSIELAHASGSYLGVDLSESAIEELKTKLQGLENADALAVDFLSSDFPDTKFDVIYARSVFHHFQYFDVFLNKLSRHLEPGGICITYDPLQTCFPVKLARAAYRPLQSDAMWEYPFDKSAFQTIQEYFKITDLRGIFGAAKWTLPIGMINEQCAIAIGRRLDLIDESKARSLGPGLWSCMQVTMRLEKKSHHALRFVVKDDWSPRQLTNRDKR